MRSTDDKAYLRPGTSEGFDKARNLRILTISDHSKARKLPKYDWPEKMVYVTPGSHRVFTKSSVMNESEEKLITEEDRHYVFVRPKAIVGSSGTVWASETLRLRYEDPLAFEVDELTPGSPQYSLGFRKCCARLHDDLFLYYDMTESDDLDNITGETESNCKFFTYEKERAKHLKLRIDNLLQFCEDTEMSEHNRALFASQIIPVTKRILDAVDDLFKEEVDSMEKDARKDRILKVTTSCKHGLEVLGDLCLPPVKPRWADLTDAGPGVGVSNYEVRFRDAELARIHNSDYRVRCHRSRGDSGQDEAERTNSAISDALVDGATLEWEKYRRFEDLSEEEIKQMSLQSYEEYEKKRMEKNAWYVCSQVAERIDDAPVLKEYIKSKVSEPPDELFFFNLFTSITIGVHQKETKQKCLVQHTSERSNRLWKTTIFVENSLWNSVVMPVGSQEMEVPISVLGVLTIDGSDQKRREFRNLCQTKTILDISWMSIKRNRQAGHQMTISRENVLRTCMINILTVL